MIHNATDRGAPMSDNIYCGTLFMIYYEHSDDI